MHARPIAHGPCSLHRSAPDIDRNSHRSVSAAASSPLFALKLHPACTLLAQMAATVCATVAATGLATSSLATPSASRTSARPVAGLPALRMSRIVCSAEKESEAEQVNGLPRLAAAVTSAATLAYAHPVFALVDERLSGEGTGLGLGLSNPRLTWILVGVTALVWALYFTYAAKLPEGDDDSGLSL